MQIFLFTNLKIMNADMIIHFIEDIFVSEVHMNKIYILSFFCTIQRVSTNITFIHDVMIITSNANIHKTTSFLSMCATQLFSLERFYYNLFMIFLSKSLALIDDNFQRRCNYINKNFVVAESIFLYHI